MMLPSFGSGRQNLSLEHERSDKRVSAILEAFKDGRQMDSGVAIIRTARVHP